MKISGEPTLHHTVLTYDERGRCGPDIELFDLEDDAREERRRLEGIWRERGTVGRHILAEVQITPVLDDDDS